ncbi:hypothetical protein EVAR_83378_1 [Eumeta japonica]|uniref:Uncharacterized protein n=1 Tax=Eumeta variegata TaxID=151549 RepID=A0A4C1TZM8_EUMVA|nr:hypothetical protein EVAR_83378_1 [Eumeta japonica]
MIVERSRALPSYLKRAPTKLTVPDAVTTLVPTSLDTPKTYWDSVVVLRTEHRDSEQTVGVQLISNSTKNCYTGTTRTYYLKGEAEERPTELSLIDCALGKHNQRRKAVFLGNRTATAPARKAHPTTFIYNIFVVSDFNHVSAERGGRNHQFGSLRPTADETQARSKEKTAGIDQQKECGFPMITPDRTHL